MKELKKIKVLLIIISIIFTLLISSFTFASEEPTGCNCRTDFGCDGGAYFCTAFNCKGTPVICYTYWCWFCP